MNKRASSFIGLAAVLAGSLQGLTTLADASTNPYRAIIDRNVFGLKPPVKPPDPAEMAPPPPKVALMGLASMGGRKIALIKFLEPPKPGQPVPQEPLVLAEGEATEDIEVVEIDEKAGRAKILNRGTTLTLDIKDYEAKVAGAGPQPAGPGGAPPGPGPRMASLPTLPRPGGPQGPSPQPPAQPSPVPKPVQSQPGQQAHSGGAAAAQASSTGAGGLVLNTTPTLPQRPIRTPEPPPMSYEEQVIMIELERERTRELFLRGEYPPLPPTELTPEEDLKLILAPEPPAPPTP
ncbi:MAG: hypothetical protein RMH97_04005 [Verrucomicrobiales bacterium]|nr:hypothetical protein [Verrucomicrobiales bacterium]